MDDLTPIIGRPAAETVGSSDLNVWYVKYQQDHLKVSVFMDSLEVTTEVTSPKYDFVSFLSNIGGVMGLFTGFSVLSFLEIIELLFDMWGYVLSFLCRRKDSVLPM